MLEISQWPDTTVFSLSVICRSATSETKSPFPPSQKMSHLQQQLHTFFSEACQVPGQKCQHCHGFCSCAAISLKCAISMHVYAGLSEISIPRTAEAWGDQVCLLCFSQVDWKIRNKKEGLVRQNNNKKFLHFPHASFSPTWQGPVKSIGIFCCGIVIVILPAHHSAVLRGKSHDFWYLSTQCKQIQNSPMLLRRDNFLWVIWAIEVVSLLSLFLSFS